MVYSFNVYILICLWQKKDNTVSNTEIQQQQQKVISTGRYEHTMGFVKHLLLTNE